MPELSSVYISSELGAFAKSINVSAVRLALSIVEGDFSHLEHDELDRLRASCTAPTPRKPDPFRALTQV